MSTAPPPTFNPLLGPPPKATPNPIMANMGAAGTAPAPAAAPAKPARKPWFAIDLPNPGIYEQLHQDVKCMFALRGCWLLVLVLCRRRFSRLLLSVLSVDVLRFTPVILSTPPLQGLKPPFPPKTTANAEVMEHVIIPSARCTTRSPPFWGGWGPAPRECNDEEKCD